MKVKLALLVLRKALPFIVGGAGAFLAAEYTALFNAFCNGGLS